MRGNSDRDTLYPLAPEPANGWGHDNPTGEYVIGYVPKVGHTIKLITGEPGMKVLGPDERSEATRFKDAAAAALAAGELLEKATVTN